MKIFLLTSALLWIAISGLAKEKAPLPQIHVYFSGTTRNRVKPVEKTVLQS